ncbi:hypothetical protein SAPIO_CDS1921 [Scedosporium apiospermum]|uniref:NACHT domain-containing protein n=1 Tax=Pseudallescheria apiosperma TaxID=563466 RepID=A0A084GE21_PSEDA|nr:uncharacterized protein SAPIO_CDS1921 [Scedosporium apiospermum]KEZ45583.1 hypothetical protein SAPIO_CDS1921 [Scedosporium apiospermum]
MRLLAIDQNGELSFTKDLGGNIPSYAILSHTWSTNAQDEVTFKDIENGTWKRKLAHGKIEFCIEQARRDGLQYLWVDTCCIDRSDPEELRGSINSMFQWYSDSAQCYVYLSDVSKPAGQAGDDQPWKAAFQRSRWFTRGWTLQELLAPGSIQFFSREGQHLGDMESLEQEIHNVTKIPISALRQTTSLGRFDVEERFGWAEKRQTLHPEDWAYSLLGLFGVFIQPMYGEGRDSAVKRLREAIESAPERREYLRKFQTCPYQDRKDRNPLAADGTLEWFTNHSLFQQWNQSPSEHILLVSGEPGSGKSVLARHLVDEVLPSTTMRTTCYFFFKEDYEDQRSPAAALCSILHQLFDQYPASLSPKILKDLRLKRDLNSFFASFSDLWAKLVEVTNTARTKREVVCVLDGLDECEVDGRNQLLDAISEFPHAPLVTPSLKFLLISRPDAEIKRRLEHPERDLPMIHLGGENEETGVDTFIKTEVKDISQAFELGKEEQNALIEEITSVPKRTYLWAHLVLSEIRNLTRSTIPSYKAPRTVSEAYDRILLESKNISLAKKLLHIVVAAARPLTLQEITLALVIGPKHKKIGEIPQMSAEKAHQQIESIGGAFVVISDHEVYLLHHTAREFLIASLSGASSPAGSSSTMPGSAPSLAPEVSHRVLAEICVQRLSLSDNFDLDDFKASTHPVQYMARHTFLQYAAGHWADHFRQVTWTDQDWELGRAVIYCHPHLQTSVWFEIYRRFTRKEVPGDFTPLLVASYFGLDQVMKHLTQNPILDVNFQDSKYGRSALSWAAMGGYDKVLQYLLRGGMIRRLLGAVAAVDVKDDSGCMPLHLASERGHSAVVRQLLDAGADAKAKDNIDRTPLHYACEQGNETVVQLLLEADADPNAKDGLKSAPLENACKQGHVVVVRLLLEAGADPNAKAGLGMTALHWSAGRHSSQHVAIVELLLEAGADVNAEDGLLRFTPLMVASREGLKSVAERLRLASRVRPQRSE